MDLSVLSFGDLSINRGEKMSNIKWEPVIRQAAAWANTVYEQQGYRPTLRQVFYRLVSDQWIPNTEASYKRLSSLTAEARRDGWFPPLADATRDIYVPANFTGLDDLSATAARSFRVDRWATQEKLVVIAVEKRGMLAQFEAEFGYYGFPIVPVAGYVSQTIADDLRELVERDGREAVLLYGGDHDASGRDIERDLIERTAVWGHTERVALTPEQVNEYQLPRNPAKDTDSRTKKFAAEFGHVQYEVDALAPDVLMGLFRSALEPFVDESLIRERVAEEDELRVEFRERNGIAA